jgi:hypothetical protein
MGRMSGGLRGLFRRRRQVEAARPAAAVLEPAVEPEWDEVELHFCCICGAMLGFDREDEIDGEGAGRDICGACNRTRNDDSLILGW